MTRVDLGFWTHGYCPSRVQDHSNSRSQASAQHNPVSSFALAWSQHRVANQPQHCDSSCIVKLGRGTKPQPSRTLRLVPTSLSLCDPAPCGQQTGLSRLPGAHSQSMLGRSFPEHVGNPGAVWGFERKWLMHPPGLSIAGSEAFERWSACW